MNDDLINRAEREMQWDSCTPSLVRELIDAVEEQATALTTANATIARLEGRTEFLEAALEMAAEDLEWAADQIAEFSNILSRDSSLRSSAYRRATDARAALSQSKPNTPETASPE